MKEKRNATRPCVEAPVKQPLGRSLGPWPFPPWPHPVQYSQPPLSDRIPTYADMKTEVDEAPF